MAGADLPTEILQGIRQDIRQTNERLDQTNERLGRLEQRQVATETRLSTELVAVVGAIHEVRDLLKDALDLRRRVDEQDDRLREHEARLARLESPKAG